MTPEELKELAELEEMDKLEQHLNTTPDTSPMAYKPTPRFIAGSGGMMIPDTTPEPMKQAAAQGVDIDTGFPAGKGIRSGEELGATNPGQWNDFLQQNLYKSLGPTAKLRGDGPSGELEFFNPETKRWTVARTNDVGQKAWSAFYEGTGLAGNLAGLAGPQKATVLAEIASSAWKTGAGSAAARYIQQSVGNARGINDQVTVPEQLNETGKEGLKQAGLDAAGGVVFNIGRYGWNRVLGKGRAFDDTTAQSLLEGMTKYQKSVDNINQYSNTEWQPLAHELVDPESAAAQIAASKYAFAQKNGDEALQRLMLSRESNTYGALRSYFTNWSSGFDGGLPMTAEGRTAAGTPLAEGIQGTIQRGNQNVQDAAIGAQQSDKQAVASLPDGRPQAAVDAGQAARAQLFAQSKVAGNETDDLYGQWQTKLGYDPTTGTTPAYYVEIKDPAIQAIIDKYGRNTLTGELKGKAPLPANEAKSARYDIGTIDAARRRLGELMRDKTDNGASITEGTFDLVGGQRDLEGVVSTYLKEASANGTMPEDSYSTWVKAKASAAREAQDFKTGFVGAFLKKDEAGRWVMRDQRIIDPIVGRKDWQALSQVHDMIKGDPVAMAEMQKYILSLYSEKATLNGLTSRKLHDKFMSSDQYGPLVEMFMKDRGKKLDSFGAIADEVAFTVQRAKVMDRALRDSLGGKITRWSPEEIVPAILSKKLSGEETANLMRIASRYPGARDSIQNGVLNEIRTKIFPQGLDSRMDLNALKSVLDSHGPNIINTMGPQYFTALSRLADNVPVILRNPPSIASPPIQSRLQSAIRVPVGIMNWEGRALTFLNKHGWVNMPEQIWEALTNPRDLERLANYTRTAVARTRVAGVSAAAGSKLLDEQDHPK